MNELIIDSESSSSSVVRTLNNKMFLACAQQLLSSKTNSQIKSAVFKMLAGFLECFSFSDVSDAVSNKCFQSELSFIKSMRNRSFNPGKYGNELYIYSNEISNCEFFQDAIDKNEQNQLTSKVDPVQKVPPKYEFSKVLW